MNLINNNTFASDFGKMNFYLNLIENPLNSSKKYNKLDLNLINALDLNITNFRKYYPEIRELLRNNESCHKDIYHDFVEIQIMSNYICDIIEEKTKEIEYYEKEVNLKKILDYLKFINNLLQEFHKILNFKIKLINNELTEENYANEYQKFKIKYRDSHRKFYKEIYSDKTTTISNSVKKIWSTEIK